ncbi:MAG: hypothetical protein ACYC4H_03475 [Desulfocucumaceae bacterium]
MDVRELAPALLALGNLVENTNKAIGESEAKVKVVVRSSFEKGSFQVSLELIYSLTEQIRLLLDFQKSDILANQLLCLIGFTTGMGISLIKLIKWVRGRPINSATVLENGDIRLELTGDNGQFDCIEVNEKVIRLFRDRTIRENLRQVLSPLEKEGINGFSVRRGKDEIESISKSEATYYQVPDEPEKEQSTTSIRVAYVNLVEIAFEEGLKWRLSDSSLTVNP